MPLNCTPGSDDEALPRVQRVVQPADDGAPDLRVPLAAPPRQAGGHATLELQGTSLKLYYTVYHRFGGRRFVCFGFDPASAMVQKLNTRNIYLRTDDKRCSHHVCRQT